MTKWYAVRCVFRWTEAGGRPYEERITLWRAGGLGLAQGYGTGEQELTDGSEVFSLLRESP